MLRNRTIAAVRYGFLLKLAYKAEMYGAKVIAADQWFPSSKTCSACGAVKPELTPGERVFKCQASCPRIDRDLNAAINLRQYAAASYAEAQNGRGESVSPSRRDVAALLGEASTPLRRRAAAMSPVPNLAMSNVAD